MVVNEMHIPQKGLEIPEGLGGGGGESSLKSQIF